MTTRSETSDNPRFDAQRVSVVGNRLRVKISPDLSISSYVQYDTDSESVGTNTRLRWTFLPVADLFVVYNHNVHSILDRWRLESNQLLVKLQYARRMWARPRTPLW